MNSLQARRMHALAEWNWRASALRLQRWGPLGQKGVEICFEVHSHTAELGPEPRSLPLSQGSRWGHLNCSPHWPILIIAPTSTKLSEPGTAQVPPHCSHAASPTCPRATPAQASWSLSRTPDQPLLGSPHTRLGSFLHSVHCLGDMAETQPTMLPISVNPSWASWLGLQGPPWL